ncbi:hypothetical protein ABTY00_35305 [Streptomyces microflavus]|uniref:hypothetical protein n=1 Tax=Streptomyces microflavus TaxID=1919 RepID=UPI00332ACAF5
MRPLRPRRSPLPAAVRPRRAHPAPLQPLRDTLALAESPRGTLQWLKNSPNAALFASLAAFGEPITHQRLDQLPPSRHLHYLRHTLVHLGALPERDEELDRIPAWLDTVLADRPTGHVRLVRPYVHWDLLRRARRHAARRNRARSSAPAPWWF